MKNFSLKKHVAHVHEEQKHTCAKYAAVENSCKHWSTWRTNGGHAVLVITNDFICILKEAGA